MLKIRAVFPRHPLFARYSKGINTVSTLFFESDLERKFPNMCSTHTYTENKHITPNLSFSGFMPKQTPLHLHRPYFGILTTTFPDQTHKKSIGVHTMNAQTGQLRPQESVRFETWQHDTCLSEIETVVSDTPQQATQFFDGSPIQKIEGVWDGQNTIGHFVGEVRITYDNGTTLEGNLDTGVSTPRIIGPATHTLTDGVKISGIMMLREDNSWGFDGPATVYYPNGTHRIGEFVLQSRGWHFVT